MQSRSRPSPLIPLEPLDDVYVLSVQNPVPAHTCRLSAAERDILCALLDGRSNQEIARLRGTSVKTVDNQVGRLFERFDVHSRMELVRKLEKDVLDE